MSLLACKTWWRNVWKNNLCLMFIVIELYVAEYKVVIPIFKSHVDLKNNIPYNEILVFIWNL